MAKSHLFTSGICVLMSVTLGIGMVPSAAFAEAGISEADPASGVANAQFDGSDDSHVGSGDNDASPDKVTQSDGSPSASADRSSGESCDGKEKSLGSEMPDGLTLAASESVPIRLMGHPSLPMTSLPILAVRICWGSLTAKLGIWLQGVRLSLIMAGCM